MSDEPATSEDATPIEAGMVVYDDDGTALGVVDGFTAAGFEVDIDAEVEDGDGDGAVNVSDPEIDEEEVTSVNREERETEQQEQVPGQEFGEGYLQWRCDDCGEIGDLEDGLPTECPNCGSDAVYRKRED
ncbi:hypothetical protein [Halogeometricum sp. CBA1124]|jgi:DNA-directed RNA polymerase subunit RPC12/RpoP|uniref:DUF7130 family rubredoxin-like protein n=1 Tax=Halogeometricum sp. CBA1124 TaxID=2668071 RepID=UPI00142C01C1|nr:hypothetical protein [Halogeometricum sp. CBA1124]MUV58320.1 hypothetical protein [Halogeometricum sp. CBA1124]